MSLAIGFKNIFIPILLLIAITSCEKNNNQYKFSDEKILELAYCRDYLYPDGFYYENIIEGTIYYENTVSVKPIEERENIWIELSTNDKSKAKEWSDFSNEYSSVNRELVSERESEKYYEFKRINVANVNDILLSRVHKSDYFISLFDRYKDPDVIGIYNGNLSKVNLKELVEYLWSCGTIRMPTKVIVSQIFENDTFFEHFIQSLDIVYGDWGMHDYIYVYDNVFTINKDNNTISVKIKKNKVIQGEFNPNP